MSHVINPVKDLPHFNTPPRTEVQVAMINAAAKIASVKIEIIGEDYNRNCDFFKNEFERIAKVVEAQGW